MPIPYCKCLVAFVIFGKDEATDSKFGTNAVNWQVRLTNDRPAGVGVASHETFLILRPQSRL